MKNFFSLSLFFFSILGLLAGFTMSASAAEKTSTTTTTTTSQSTQSQQQIKQGQARQAAE